MGSKAVVTMSISIFLVQCRQQHRIARRDSVDLSLIGAANRVPDMGNVDVPVRGHVFVENVYKIARYTLMS